MTESPQQARRSMGVGDPWLAAEEEIGTALRAHEAVRGVHVATLRSLDGATEIVAYVVPDDARLPRAAPDAQVGRWRKVFDLMHTPAPGASPVAGAEPRPRWTSRQTRQPFPDDEIEEWIGATVALVDSLGPAHVLEIGVGSGVLCARLARRCQSYLGTDFSARSLEQLGAYLAGARPPLAHVTLMERAANDLAGLVDDAFDTVVVNSVIQYFPNAGYLEEMMAGALRVTRPGGTILLGDVRSLPLLEPYCTSLELARAVGELPLPALAARVHRQIAQQDELLLSPAYFARWPHPKVAHVEVRPKRGRYDNELTSYRFEALITVGPAEQTLLTPAWTDWEPPMSEATLAGMIAARGSTRWGLRGIANARIARAAAAWARLDTGATGDVRALQAELEACPPAGLSPERVAELGEAAGLRVRLSFSRAAADGSFDAVFERADLPPPPIAWDWGPASAGTATNPALGARRQSLVPLLLAHCEAQLGAGRRPSSIVVVDRLPDGASL